MNWEVCLPGASEPVEGEGREQPQSKAGLSRVRHVSWTSVLPSFSPLFLCFPTSTPSGDLLGLLQAYSQGPGWGVRPYAPRPGSPRAMASCPAWPRPCPEVSPGPPPSASKEGDDCPQPGSPPVWHSWPILPSRVSGSRVHKEGASLKCVRAPCSR